MVQKIVDVGVSAGDGTGDPLRTAMQYINENFSEIYSRDAVGSFFEFTENTISVTNTNGNINLQPAGTGKIILDWAIWPLNDGTAGYVLKTDGSGNLSWVSLSTAAAAGTDTQIQFNDGGTVSGNANLTFNKVDGSISVRHVNALGTTGNLFNTTATTINLGGAATVVNVGAVTGNVNVKNNLTIVGNTTLNDILTTSSSMTIAPANATSINIGGATSNVNFAGNLVVSGQIAAGDLQLNTISPNVATGTPPINVNSTTRVANLNVEYAGTLINGNSNVIVESNANVTINVSGNSAIAVFTGTGANIGGTANITGAANIGGTLGVTGNANVGNLGVGRILATGNITSPQLISNVITGTAPLVVTSTTQVANLNVALAGNAVNLDNGTSNVVVTNNGNITVGSAGNAAIFTVTGTGANVSGTANVSGNANVGNLGTNTAVITTANITTINSGLLQNGTSNIVVNSNGNVNVSVGGNANVFTITGTGVNVGNLGVSNITVTNVGATTANLTTINSGLMQNGNSNVTITANSNVSVFVNGNATARAVFTSTGANIAGTANITGNANVGNLGTTGNVSANNITATNEVNGYTANIGSGGLILNDSTPTIRFAQNLPGYGQGGWMWNGTIPMAYGTAPVASNLTPYLESTALYSYNFVRISVGGIYYSGTGATTDRLHKSMQAGLRWDGSSWQIDGGGTFGTPYNSDATNFAAGASTNAGKVQLVANAAGVYITLTNRTSPAVNSSTSFSLLVEIISTNYNALA